MAFSWPVDGLDGVECLRAAAMRHSYGRHCHDAYAVGVIEAGVGGNRCRGADHFNAAGSIVVMNPGEAHTGYAAGSIPLSYRMFYIKPRALLRALPENTGPPYFKALCISDACWARRLRELHRCLESPTDPMEKQARFHGIFGAFSFCFTRKTKPARAGLERSAVREVKDYLQANYAAPITIDALARLTRLNRDYLIRSFSRDVGMPPYTYLTQVRVENAKKLLASGVPPVRAALEVGFADQSHLNRHFKKLT
ncbi:MAG: AraC family transcriptional regulator, partial [Desulfosarcinaceae bacterium]